MQDVPWGGRVFTRKLYNLVVKGRSSFSVVPPGTQNSFAMPNTLVQQTAQRSLVFDLFLSPLRIFAVSQHKICQTIK
jgi:hypothetical protein